MTRRLRLLEDHGKALLGFRDDDDAEADAVVKRRFSLSCRKSCS